MALTLPEWVLLITGLLTVAVVVGGTAARYRLPMTAVLAVVGLLAGWVGSGFGVVSPLRGELFTEVVTVLFLPILVFQGALGLNTRAFLRNLGPILVLAIPAVLVSAALVGGTLHFTLGVGLAAALLFGALISATDPVAVVAVFEELHVPPRLLALVEGESLLNDAVAIVLFEILVTAALGGHVGFASGVLEFATVFFGGILIGTVTAFFAALLLPWLRPMPAATLTLAGAYGSFLLSEEILGFSGVMATVSAGLVLGAVAPSRASAEVRALWRDLWRALGYIANALLFLFIGLAIDVTLIAAHAWAIGLTVIAVLVARPLAVVPLLSGLERVTRIAPLDLRNLVTLVWGGLRGGVALALALALPEALPERPLFISLAGGVVLTTLLLNATSIRLVVEYTGLARPTRADRFLAASAHLTGISAALERIRALDLDLPDVVDALEDAEGRVMEELGRIPLREDEEVKVVMGRGLRVERDTYQHLRDAGLIPPPVARTLLDEVDDHIEKVTLDRPRMPAGRDRAIPGLDRLLSSAISGLPPPLGESAEELAYAEATARRLAARRTADALALFERLPNVRNAPIEEAKALFARWEEEAIEELRAMDGRVLGARRELSRRQAEAMSRLAAEDALEGLVDVGLLPRTIAEHASIAVGVEARAAPPR